MISITAQIEEAERELSMRAGFYPRQVMAGKMRQSVADLHMERLRAALRTLEWVRDNADDLRKRAMEERA